jgi:hypothetical protein
MEAVAAHVHAKVESAVPGKQRFFSSMLAAPKRLFGRWYEGKGPSGKPGAASPSPSAPPSQLKRGKKLRMLETPSSYANRSSDAARPFPYGISSQRLPSSSIGPHKESKAISLDVFSVSYDAPPPKPEIKPEVSSTLENPSPQDLLQLSPHFPPSKARPSAPFAPISQADRSRMAQSSPIVERHRGIPLFRIPTSALMAHTSAPFADSEKGASAAGRSPGVGPVNKTVNGNGNLPSVGVSNSNNDPENERESTLPQKKARGLSAYLISWRDAMVSARKLFWKGYGEEKRAPANANLDRSYVRQQRMEEKIRKRHEKEEAKWQAQKARAREQEREIRLIREELKGTVLCLWYLLFDHF